MISITVWRLFVAFISLDHSLDHWIIAHRIARLSLSLSVM